MEFTEFFESGDLQKLNCLEREDLLRVQILRVDRGTDVKIGE